MSTARVTGSFTYKMKSGKEVEFDYVGIFYGVEDHLADEVQDVCPSWGEYISEAEAEDEQEAIEEAALNAAIAKFREEYPNR
jgi:hypothetical protein